MTQLYIWASTLTERFRRDEEGQSLVEWALILALVAVVAIAILGTIGTNITTKLTEISTSI